MDNITIKSAEQISNYLARLRLESRKIILRSGLQEASGMVIESSLESASILFRGNFTPKEDSINIQFMLGGDYFFGSGKILESEQNKLTVALPEVLENRTIRKYPRVFIKDQAFCRFHIITDTSKPEKEVNTASAPPKLASIYFELQKNVPDIKKVLTMVGEEIKNTAENSEIKLHKVEENFEDEDEIKIVKQLHLPFWIAASDDIKNFVKDIPSGDAVNFSQFYKQKKEMGWNNEKIRQEILKRQLVYTQKKIYSLIHVPISLFNNVVGHITAFTTTYTMKELHLNDVYYLKALADVVSEALAKARLFKLDTGVAYDIPVINISAGGSYIEVNSQYIIKFLQEEMKLSIGFKIDNKEIGAIAEIRRIDFLGGKVRIALQFIEIANETHQFVETYVRGKIGERLVNKKEQTS